MLLLVSITETVPLPVFGTYTTLFGAIAGAAIYVYRVFAVLVPLGVVMATLAVPAEPTGVVAVIEVALTTTRLVAAAPPMVTPVAPLKSVPVIVTD